MSQFFLGTPIWVEKVELVILAYRRLNILTVLAVNANLFDVGSVLNIKGRPLLIDFEMDGLKRFLLELGTEHAHHGIVKLNGLPHFSKGCMETVQVWIQFFVTS